jgi:hypothetical protein
MGCPALRTAAGDPPGADVTGASYAAGHLAWPSWLGAGLLLAATAAVHGGADAGQRLGCTVGLGENLCSACPRSGGSCQMALGEEERHATAVSGIPGSLAERAI